MFRKPFWQCYGRNLTIFMSLSIFRVCVCLCLHRSQARQKQCCCRHQQRVFVQISNRCYKNPVNLQYLIDIGPLYAQIRVSKSANGLMIRKKKIAVSLQVFDTITNQFVKSEKITCDQKHTHRFSS